MPCRTIVSSVSLTLSCRGRGIFLALQNIGCDPGMSFTCALYPLTASSLSSLTALMPWGSMSLPSSPNFCRIAQLLVVVAYTCVRSTQHHMLVIPEASVDDRHRPQEVWTSQFNWGLPSSGQINDDIKGAISTGIILHFYFMVLYWNLLPYHRHVKRVFLCIVRYHLHFGWFLTRQFNVFIAEIVVLVRLTRLRLGFTSPLFWKVPHLFTGVTFLVQCWTRLATVWLTSTSNTQVTIVFFTSYIFTRFSEGLFEVVSHFFFYYKESNTCRGTRKSHCLTCEL